MGTKDGVLVFDPSAFPKSGARRGGGSAVGWAPGQSRPRQVAISLGYVSRMGHTLVALRLSLPQAWTQEKTAWKKPASPQPAGVTARGTNGPWRGWRKPVAALPHRWMAGDDEMGRPSWWRRRLAALGER